jgi:hypothetical protein
MERIQNMSNLKDLTGMTFGRLTVIKYAGVNKHQKRLWLCSCSCGEVTILPTYHLTRKVEPVRSCGCLGREILRKRSTKHGQRHNRIYYVWQNMRRRCYDDTLPQYKDYGGRGIKVCSEWDDFNNFWKWAEKSGYSNELTIDRIDVNGNYCPENCRWVGRKKQSNNKRNNDYLTYKGVTKTRQEWAEEYDINVDHLRVLLKRFDRDIEFIIDYMLKQGYKQQKFQHLTKWKKLYKEYKSKF